MFGPIQAARRWAINAPDRAIAILLAVASYVPILLTSPGRVSADTKTYLTLDPSAVLSQATSMWDPTVGAGTVPHQNIGYLFPLGPYYWVMEAVGSPDWFTQRLLWGTLVFAAAYGTYRLARWLGWGATGALVTAFAYGFSPYLLSYLARLSVILGPWAALPWMILLAAKAARTRSWRPAAQFAVVVALVGSVNATALLLAGLGPVIWLVADVTAKRVAPGAAVRAAAKIGALTAAVSVWWIAALRIQGNYGLPILEYTETYDSVASASTPAEVLRGLGYWFFYGGDNVDLWVGPSLPYIDQPLIIALGFALAGAGLLGFLVTFPRRATAALLLLIGLAISVGAAPLGSSTAYGSIFDWFASDTTVGLAMRSTPRAAPLVILAMAFGLGASSEYLRGRLRDRVRSTRQDTRWDLLVPAGAIGLLMVQLFPWFTADSLTPSLLRDEALPAYEVELADWLDETRDPDGGGRVYELPASDFANYRWGGTVDPALPGILDRPYLARELVPQGGAGTADLLNAIERRLPEGWFEPESLAIVAQRFGVDTIVTRNDLEHERYGLVQPGQLWTDITSALGDPDHAGPLITDQTLFPVLDQPTATGLDAAQDFPAVAAFDLTPTPPVTSVSAASPIVLAGSGDGIVDMAGAGLLDPERPLLYAGTLADLAANGSFEPELIGDDPWWVISDTNRKQSRHWATVSANLGPLETAEAIQIDNDPRDAQLDIFSDNTDWKTIGVHRGEVSAVRASYYGHRVAQIPEDAPRFAIDGDPTTAWRAGVFAGIADLVWEVDLREPSSATTITILQPTTGITSRFITEIRVTLDDETSFDVVLNESSRQLPGQEVALPGTPFAELRIEVLADNLGELSHYIGQPSVGFAEVTIPGVADDYFVRVPDLADFEVIDDGQLDEQRLTYLLTRQRAESASPLKLSPEPFLLREFEVPDGRSFTVTGEVRTSTGSTERPPLDLECRDDILVLDGEPLPVRILGPAEDALPHAELALEACSDTIDLAAGRHHLAAFPAASSGIDVDRLTLDSDPRSTSDGPAAAAPLVTATRIESTELDLEVGASATPSWLILQQSWNEGWAASIDGVDLGPPILIDGYANGWVLPSGVSDRSVELRWEPQETIRLALWFSLLAGIGVLGFALFGRRPKPVPLHEQASGPVEETTRGRLIALAGVLVVVIGFVGGLPAAVCALAITLLGARWRWLAPTVVVLTGSIVAGAVIASEWRYDFPPGPDWPDRFGWTSPLVWVAVSAVVVSAIIPRGVSPRASEPASPGSFDLPDD